MKTENHYILKGTIGNTAIQTLTTMYNTVHKLPQGYFSNGESKLRRAAKLIALPKPGSMNTICTFEYLDTKEREFCPANAVLPPVELKGNQ